MLPPLSAFDACFHPRWHMSAHVRFRLNANDCAGHVTLLSACDTTRTQNAGLGY